MLQATSAFAFFDYFRVPYELVETDQSALPGWGWLWAREGTAGLGWPLASGLASPKLRSRAFFLDDLPLVGRVAPEDEVRRWLDHSGGKWSEIHTLRDSTNGSRLGAVWQRDDGSILLPFNPGEVMQDFWSEDYLEYSRSGTISSLASIARRSYYRVRPLLPRAAQMRIRRSFSQLQSKAQFPRWPIESALHDFYDFLFRIVANIAAAPVPYIGLWPGRHTWAFVLTHDVETQVGYDKLPELLRLEADAGYRSSWNFVPQNRYVVKDELLQSLRERGFEIGVHGYRHDGRDLSSAKNLRRRLPAIREYAERWQAKGFRSPATLRSPDLMPLLGFDYDSSYTDTAPFEPQAGGCCTWLPYMMGELVELPITLTQDHTLFDLLGYNDETVWVEKARFLRDRGGMALVLSHPDYIETGHLLPAYDRLLEEFADDSSAWKALPRDVSDWWRRRSASSLEQSNGSWHVDGPAKDDAKVEFVTPDA